MRTRFSKLRARLRGLLVATSDDPEIVAAAPEVTVREVFRRFWPEARPFRRWIPVLLLLIAVGTALVTAEIWLFKIVVDDVLVAGDLSLMLPIALAYVTITLLSGLSDFLDDYLSTWMAERFLLNLRVRLLSHLHGLSVDALDRRRLGDLLSRITSDVQRIEGFVLSGVADGLSSVMRILFFGGALFILNWQLALVAVVVVPLFYAVGKAFSQLIRSASREKSRRVGSLSSLAEESLANAALVQALNRQEIELKGFRRENEGVVRAELTSVRIRGLFAPLISLIELLGVLVVIVLGAFAVDDGTLTVGGLLVFIAYLSQLLDPVREIGSLANSMFRALAGAERVIELLDEEPQVVDKPGAVRIGRSQGRVALERVDYTYPGSSQPALRGVDLVAAPGETVALVGPSGAGKSTLAKLLLRFADPDAGAVRLDGLDLRDAEIASVRDNVSVLLQEALLLHGTIRHNIAMGREGATEEEIRHAAQRAGALGFIEALPDGFETDLGERGRRLSGGQRQRIAIARALIADAPVLVLDEPSTGLDANARDDLAEPLRELISERTTIVISHDLLLTRDADRIVVLDDGAVVEAGTHDDLVERDGLYSRLWALHDPEREGVPA